VRKPLAVMLGLVAESHIEVAELAYAATLDQQLQAFRTRLAPRDARADQPPAPHTDLTPGADARVLVEPEDAAQQHQTAAGAAHSDRGAARPPTFNEALGWGEQWLVEPPRP
jgi:hypothetical protein